jgi:mannose-6-phosphate isomerase-like protein (cupin superfamily)
MNIFLDIDNTICKVDEKLDASIRYSSAEPIVERIAYANKLYDQGNRITYWTARGKASGKDYSELTKEQLRRWNAKYHELRFDKPSYDLYVDDKSENTTNYFERVLEPDRFAKPVKVSKGWGYELVITNTPKYCGKIMHFNKGAKFSMHYHILKTETWYVQSGAFEFRYIDTSNASIITKHLNVGDVVTNEIGQPHQIICLEEGDVFEVSTQHFDSDSYRVLPGDSQCALCEEKPEGLFIGHMGLGDQIFLAPAMAKCAAECKKLYIITKGMYIETLRHMLNLPNVEFLAITNSLNYEDYMRDINVYIDEYSKRCKVYASGMFNRNQSSLNEFPICFYKDLNLDWTTVISEFKFPTTKRAYELLKLVEDQEYVFVHLNASNNTVKLDDSLKNMDILIINPEENMYKPHEKYYELANNFIRSKAYLTVLDYKEVIANASKLVMIDSCYFSLALMIETKANDKVALYRSKKEFSEITKRQWRSIFIE